VRGRVKVRVRVRTTPWACYISPISPHISSRSFLLSVAASLLLVVLITTLGIIYTFCGGEP